MNHACFDWAALLTDSVLHPLCRGEGINFRPPAWVEHGRSGTIDVPAGLDVVWVEGTGVIRRELASVLDAAIYVQGDLDVQEKRLVARDGDSPEQQELVLRWMEEELPFMAREQPWAYATIVLNGTSDLVHDPDTELVAASPVRG